MALKIGPNVAWQIVDGEAVVVDLASGTTIGLNPTATFLWSQVAGGNDAQQIAAAVATEFGIAADDAAADTDEFLSEMQRRQLVVDAEAR